MTVRVLLVDEDEGRADLARRMCRSAHIELVGSARDVGEAARLLQRTAPDLVLLDLRFRGGQEFETCRTLSALSPAPVVALASFMTPERWRSASRAGVAAYLLKRVDTERLGRELQQIASRYHTTRSERKEKVL